MAQAVIRAFPIYINDTKVAEASNSTEDRTVNAANQYGVDGVLGQSIGADETKVDFDVIVPITGTGIRIDDLIGVPVGVGVLRNGRLMRTNGVITSSAYTSTSKSGEATGKFSFIGGAPVFFL